MISLWSAFEQVRAWLAYIILKIILGWSFKQDLSSYTVYKTGKFVAIYLHTSLYDHLIGVLFSYALGLKFITIGANRSNKETQTTGFRYLIYNLFDTIIVDPHKDRKTTCESITSDLGGRDNFIFSIYPEGSIYRTSGLKSGFYKIAKNLKSDILLFDMDYHEHTVDLRKIIDSNIVLTAPYSRIIEITSEEIVSGIPFDSTRTYLLNAVHDKHIKNKNDKHKTLESDQQNPEISAEFELFSDVSHDLSRSAKEHIKKRDGSISEKGKQTSLININRSWLRFVPFYTVILIGLTFSYNMIFN